MKIGDVCNLLGVKRHVVSKLVHDGVINAKRIGYRTFEYRDIDVRDLHDGGFNDCARPYDVIYARVSSTQSKRKLLGAVERLGHWYEADTGEECLRVYKERADIGGPVQCDEFDKLTRLVESGRVRRVIVETRESLPTHDFNSLAAHFASHGCEIVVIDDPITDELSPGSSCDEDFAKAVADCAEHLDELRTEIDTLIMQLHDISRSVKLSHIRR